MASAEICYSELESVDGSIAICPKKKKTETNTEKENSDGSSHQQYP